MAQTDILGAEVTETLRGIGAQDRDYIHALNRYPLRAGEVHAQARYEANWMRRRAFDALPDFSGGAITFHPIDLTTLHERRVGIPGW